MWSRWLGRTGYPTRSENIGGPAGASSIRHVNVGGTGPLAPSRGSKNDIAALYSLGQTSDVGCKSAAARGLRRVDRVDHALHESGLRGAVGGRGGAARSESHRHAADE